MDLLLPRTVRAMQRDLRRAAKRRPRHRFDDLLDLVLRDDVLVSAHEWVRHKGGSAGADGVVLRDLSDAELLAWVRTFAALVREGRYAAGPLLRVAVPKPAGGERVLGVPGVEDRVLQTAVRFVIEPIFDAGFLANAYGYRQGRGVRQAVAAVHRLLCDGHTTVIDADVRKFFDEVPHAELIEAVSDRISDRRVLDLIRSWIAAPFVAFERVRRGRRRFRVRRRIARVAGRGLPQGAAMSPLLANVYIHRFLVPWDAGNMDDLHQAAIVDYADDFVVLTRGSAPEVLPLVDRAFRRMGLELHATKTRIVDVRRTPLAFLGYEFRVEPIATPGAVGDVVIAEPSAAHRARRLALLRDLIPRYFAAKDAASKAALERELRPLVPEPATWRGRLATRGERAPADVVPAPDVAVS